MNACLQHTDTETRHAHAHTHARMHTHTNTHTISFVRSSFGTHQTVPMKRKKGERGRRRDLKSVARGEINGTA